MNPTQLLDDIDRNYSEAELRDLVRRLDVSYDALDGSTPRDKARELIRHLSYRGRLTALLAELLDDRPHLIGNYAPIRVDATSLGGVEAQKLPGDTALTWRWPSRPDLALSGADEPASSEVSASEDRSVPPPPAETTNPYTPGPAVVDPAMFFGREAELGRLWEQLDHLGHTAVVGARRIGKSSLLAALSRFEGGVTAGERVLPAALDLSEARDLTLPGLLQNVWAQWWSTIRPTPPPSLSSPADFDTLARKLRAAGFRPLLCLDELEGLLRRPDEFGENLLDTWEALGRERQVFFITASQSPPADLFGRSGLTSGFYNLFTRLDLGLLDETAARALLTAPAQRQGLTVPEGAADYLLGLCGPHPFYLQLAGFFLYDGLREQTYSRAQITERFRAAAEPHWERLWNSLSPPARATLRRLPLRSPAPADERQLRLLIRRGLAILDEGTARPFSEGFAAWMQTLPV